MAVKDIPMSRLLKLSHEFNCFYLKGLRQGDCKPLVVCGAQVGLVRPDVAAQLLGYPEVFHVHPDAIRLNPAFRDFDERSARVEEVLTDCRRRGVFVTLKGWRDECYAVRTVFSGEPLLKMDRCATCLFGICNYGVDINGYVNDPEKGLCIWLQKRSKTKQTWPGRWDNMVGGGLSVGYGVLETAYKEAEEEASITSDMMKNLRRCGCVSFFYESERGLFPNTEFVFDLELPLDFVPKNNDGEVDKFELLPAKEALERVLSPDFKTSSCPVVIDFLIRHGHINPDTEPAYPEIVELLHVPLQSMYKGFQNGTTVTSNNEIDGINNKLL
ncbi:uncharacterized protein YJR142W-like isoform X2 [Nilaparvata lugens]|uniref:uncharacterized protein YJR142W-like isoform X2 n=1 Tax=Nilaparvata lugens TaxID=108931 RepID=UPI00193D6902|nr:uncharacterized protein YJR142W-like isoform X2 [Nilaparvata lugens]